MRAAIKTPRAKASALNAGRTIIIAAGGTGGHIAPGVSIAEEWLKLGGNVIFATLVKNFTYPDVQTLAKQDRVTIVAYDAPKLSRNPFAIPRFLKRFSSSLKLLRQAAATEHVVAVVGMGGYSSFPAVFFAIRHRKLLFLCEQNAHWGTVTRIGKYFATKVFLSFPAKSKKLGPKFLVTGNPLRSMFNKFKSPPRPAKKTKPVILFIGGSQGAHDLNQLYQAFIRRSISGKYQCRVAAGQNGIDEMKTIARRTDNVTAFIEDMPSAYTQADFVVARCGSGTLFELAWAQKPCLLIPYPHAAANHQRANADAFREVLDCQIFDARPFDAEAAADMLIETAARHIGSRPAAFTRKMPNPEATAETKITRYITERL
jgi:UDP-N-acetylglucosamine--N-acetylmuramyl-(pentapeptide) pyrophosphoryl-undecaprenol N-acetylglucosamine transferase